MHASIKPIDEILHLNGILFDLAFDDLTEDLARERPGGSTNPAVWILAHAVTARTFIANLIGIDAPMPWEGQFNGSYASMEGGDMPSLAEIGQTWNAISRKLTARLPELTDADLAGGLPRPFPTKEQNVLSGISFLAQHEAFHLGQISYLRRILDRDGLFEILIRKSTEAA